MNAAIAVVVELRWADSDAYGHVNNVAVLRILEEARSIGLGRRGLDLIPPLAASQDLWVLVARVEASYLRPIEYGEGPVRVALTVSRVGGADFDVAYELYTTAGGGPAVTAHTTLVFVNRETGKPTRIDAETRRRLHGLRLPTLAGEQRDRSTAVRMPSV